MEITHEMLNPPGIVDIQNGKTQTLVDRIRDIGLSPKQVRCQSSAINFQEVITPLARPLRVKPFFYEKNKRYYEFLLDESDKLVGARIYQVNDKDKPTELEKIFVLYPNASVIFYRNVQYPLKVADITNPENSTCIQPGSHGITKELKDAYDAFIEHIILEELREKFKKEGGEVA